MLHQTAAAKVKTSIFRSKMGLLEVVSNRKEATRQRACGLFNKKEKGQMQVQFRANLGIRRGVSNAGCNRVALIGGYDAIEGGSIRLGTVGMFEVR